VKLSKAAITANAVATGAAMAFGVVALVDPTALTDAGTSTSAVDMYAQFYAARAIPLGAALLVSLFSRHKRGLLPLLAVSGAAQFGDLLVGAAQGVPGMIIGGGTVAAVHLATVGVLLTGDSRRAAVGA
jgi:hypothetical protein